MNKTDIANASDEQILHREDKEMEPETRLELKRVSDIQPRPITWLWPGRIPKGEITMVDGKPKQGKGTMLMNVVAQITTGMPLHGQMENSSPQNVILISAEDCSERVVRPRLEVAGADLDRVHFLESVAEKNQKTTFILPKHIAALGDAIKKHSISLVIIDPFNAYLSSRTDANSEQDVRQLLTPLTHLAQTENVAIVCVRHLRETASGSAIEQGLGSIGFSAAARSVLLVHQHPADPDIKILAHAAGNLGQSPPSLQFRIVSHQLNENITTSSIRWAGECSLSADDLLAAPEEISAIEEAENFLLDYLGTDRGSAKAVYLAAKEVEISKRTLDRAKSRLKIACTKDTNGTWVWSLPEK